MSEQKPKPAASTPPRNPGLLKLVEARRQWHNQPDASDARRGFLGWHERGYLPHFDAPHVTQFVTFMLHDSFSVKRRQEWEGILYEPDESLRRRKLEMWLDRGHGECWLRQPAVASQVEHILRADHGKACRLQAWVVMPNHIHLVVDVWDGPCRNCSIFGKAGVRGRRIKCYTAADISGSANISTR